MHKTIKKAIAGVSALAMTAAMSATTIPAFASEYEAIDAQEYVNSFENPETREVAQFYLDNGISGDELKDMIGGKALGLAKLRASEIRIPKTYVIPYYVEIKDNEIKNLLDENKKYAVRSSANAEDGGIHSFAGMFDSYLNVEKKNIIE